MNKQRLRVVIDNQEFLVNGHMEIFHNTGEEGHSGSERLVARYNVKDDKFEIAENSTGTGKLAEAPEAPGTIKGNTPNVSQATLDRQLESPSDKPPVSQSLFQQAVPAPLHNQNQDDTIPPSARPAV